MSPFLAVLLSLSPGASWGGSSLTNSSYLPNLTDWRPNLAPPQQGTTLAEQLDALEQARQAGLPEQATRLLQEIAARGDEQAIDALTDLIYRLEGRLQFAAVHAIALSESAYAHERLRDLAGDRKRPSVRRQAARDLARGSEGDRLWLRDKRLYAERDPMLRAELLHLLLEAEVPRLENAVLAAAKSAQPVAAGIGIEGVGRLHLERGLPAVQNALAGRDPMLRRTAIEALAAFGGPRATSLLLDAYAAPENLALRPLMTRILWQAENPATIATLAKLGLRHGNPEVVLLAADVLSLHADRAPQACLPPLSRLLQAEDPTLLARAVEGLVLLHPRALASLLAGRLRELDHNDPAAAELLWALQEGERLPPRLVHDLPQWLQSTAAPVRMQSLRLLSQTAPDADTHPLAVAALQDPAWPVRLAAVDCLRAWRQTEDLPLLLAAFGEEHGRVQESLRATLCSLTGCDFGNSPAAWASWWEEQSSEYRLPEQVAATPTSTEAPSLVPAIPTAGAPHHTVSLRRYHDLPLPAGGLVFLLDASGSMEEPFDSEHTQFEVYAAELLDSIGSLGTHSPFDILLFSTEVRAWRPHLEPRTATSLASAETFLAQAKLGGPTNLHEALLRALAVPEVETVFLLSDGDPTAGAIQDPETLLRMVARANRHLGVRIHTIAVGNPSGDFLQRLAAQNDGTAVELAQTPLATAKELP